MVGQIYGGTGTPPNDFGHGSVHDGAMRAEWLWGRDWWRLGRVVLLEAVFMGLLGHALFEDLLAAALYAGVMTAVFLACLAVVPVQWRGGRNLAPEDRRAVAEAVFGGEEIGETRLAPATLDLARLVVQRAERERRHDTLFRAIGVLFLVLMTVVYLAGPSSEAPSFALFTLGWGTLIVGAPMLRDRNARSAGRAHDLALTHIEHDLIGGR
jgi:hypothetical protein